MSEADCPVYPGGRVDEHDPRYATLVRGFNLRWVGSPAYVQVTGSTEQVVKTVQEAVDRNLRITVRSGGHCYENFAVGNEGGVIVDMAREEGRRLKDGRIAFRRATHQEIANRIGTTRETVTRMLKDLERQGLIQVEGKELVVQPDFERVFD